MKKQLSIIIVNYFSEDLVVSCLDSIRNNEIAIEKLDIIVVDNGSRSQKLNDYKALPLIILKPNRNLGFGAACNLGSKSASSDILLFLNPDTVVFENSFTDALMFFNKNPKITVMGCQQVNENNKIVKTCTEFITLKKYLVKSFYLDRVFPNIFRSYLLLKWDHKNSEYVNHVMGSFYMIRKKDFKQVNGFDEDFFVYYEDLDLSKRIIDNGGLIYYNTDIKIYHETGGTSKNFKAHRLFYSLSALLIFGKKHFSKPSYIILKFFVLLIEPIIRLIFALLQLNLNTITQTIKAYKLLYKR